MSATPGHGTKFAEVAKHCLALCFGEPEGPGAQLKTQMDRWRGAFALGVWIVGAGLGLLAIVVTISMALLPGLVRSAVATSSAQVVPPLVDSAVAAALKRHGIVEQAPAAPPPSVIVQAPSAPWMFPRAHADEMDRGLAK